MPILVTNLYKNAETIKASNCNALLPRYKLRTLQEELTPDFSRCLQPHVGVYFSLHIFRNQDDYGTDFQILYSCTVY